MKLETNRTLVSDLGSSSASATGTFPTATCSIFTAAYGCELRFQAVVMNPGGWSGWTTYHIRLRMYWYDIDGGLYYEGPHSDIIDTGISFYYSGLGVLGDVEVRVYADASIYQIEAIYQEILGSSNGYLVDYNWPHLIRNVRAELDVPGEPTWNSDTHSDEGACPASYNPQMHDPPDNPWPLWVVDPSKPSPCLEYSLEDPLVQSHTLKLVDGSTVSGDTVSEDVTYRAAYDELKYDFPIRVPPPKYPYHCISDLSVTPDVDYLANNLWKNFQQYYKESVFLTDGAATKDAFRISHQKTVTALNFDSSTLTQQSMYGAVAIRSNNSGSGSRIRILNSSTAGIWTQLGFSTLADDVGDGYSPAEIVGDSLYSPTTILGHLDLEIDETWTEIVSFSGSTYSLDQVISTIDSSLTHGTADPSPKAYFVNDQLTVRVARNTPIVSGYSFVWSFTTPKSWRMYRYHQYEMYAMKLSPTVSDTPTFINKSPAPIVQGAGKQMAVKLDTDAEHITTIDTAPDLVDYPDHLDFGSFQGGFTYTFVSLYLTRYAPEDPGTEISKRDGGYAVISVNFKERLLYGSSAYNEIILEIDGKQMSNDFVLHWYNSARTDDLYVWASRLASCYGITVSVESPPSGYDLAQGFLNPVYRQDISSEYVGTATPRFWLFGSMSTEPMEWDVENYSGCQYHALVFRPDTFVAVGSGQNVDRWFTRDYRSGRSYPADDPPISLPVHQEGPGGDVITTVPFNSTQSNEIMTVGSITESSPYDYFNVTDRAVDSTDQVAGNEDPISGYLVHRTLNESKTVQQTSQWSHTLFIQDARSGDHPDSSVVITGASLPGWILRAGSDDLTDINRVRAFYNYQREFLEIDLYGYSVVIAGHYVSVCQARDRTVHIVYSTPLSGSVYENTYSVQSGLQGSTLVRAPGRSPSTWISSSGSHYVVYENQDEGNIYLVRRELADPWYSADEELLFSGSKPCASMAPEGVVVAYHNGTDIALRWGTGYDTSFNFSDEYEVASAPSQRPSILVMPDSAIMVFYLDSSLTWKVSVSRDSGANWQEDDLPTFQGDYVNSAVYLGLMLSCILSVDSKGKLYWTDLYWKSGDISLASSSREIGDCIPNQYSAAIQLFDGSLLASYFDGQGNITVFRSPEWRGLE